MMQCNQVVRQYFFNRDYAGVLRGDDVYEAEVGSLSNGDVVRFMLRVHDHRVADVRYLVFGSVLTVAGCAYFAEKIHGISGDVIKQIKSSDCLQHFGLSAEMQSPLLLICDSIAQAWGKYSVN